MFVSMALVIEGEDGTLRFEHRATLVTRWGGCGCLGASLLVVLFVPIFWLAGVSASLHCDRGTAMCERTLRSAESFPISAFKGVKTYRYHYGSRSSFGFRRALELTVEGKPDDKLRLCDGPDEPEVVAEQRKVQLGLLAFLSDPKAAPVVDVTCEVERFNSQDKLVYTLAGVVFALIAMAVAAVPRKVLVTFDGGARILRYEVRRIALARGVREVGFDDVKEVELATGRTRRTRALTLVLKNGEHWALASAAIGTIVDGDLEICKRQIDDYLVTSSG